jgi:hypothetical protein
MRALSRILVAASLSLASARALAAGAGASFASAAVTRTSDVAHVDGDKYERDITILNISAAYGMGSGFVVGAKYWDYSADDDLLSDDNLTLNGYGPMVGFMHQSGFYANVAYLLFPEKAYKAQGVTTKLHGGNGYVVDVGHVWDVGSSFGVGLAVSQSHVAYEKETTAGTEESLSGTWSDDSLYPYASLFIYF